MASLVAGELIPFGGRIGIPARLVCPAIAVTGTSTASSGRASQTSLQREQRT